MQKAYEYNLELELLFMDFQGAFQTINKNTNGHGNITEDSTTDYSNNKDVSKY